MSEQSEYNASPEGRARALNENLRTELRRSRDVNLKQAKMLEKALGIIAEVSPHRLAEFGIGAGDMAGEAGEQGDQGAEG